MMTCKLVLAYDYNIVLTIIDYVMWMASEGKL